MSGKRIGQGIIRASVRHPDLIYFGLLALLFGLALGFVGTRGEFPLNDDWAYARSVWVLLQEGRLYIEEWPAMTLVAQVFWGASFAKVFGLSFEALRWSTLASAFAACAAMYFLAKKLSGPREARVAGISLFLNPLIFSLSFTFMTDVPFLAALLAACLFFVRYLEQARAMDFVLALIFSVIATGIRQPGIFVPLAFGFALAFRARSPGDLFLAGLPFLATLFLLQGYLEWLGTHQPELTKVGGFGLLVEAMLGRSLKYFPVMGLTTMLYVGLFSLPLVLWLFPSKSPNRKGIFGLLLAFAVMLTLLLLFKKPKFPIGNILYNLGLGPKLLKDAYWGINLEPSLPGYLWSLTYALGLGGILGAGVLIWPGGSLPGIKAVLVRVKQDDRTAIRIALALFCLFYFIFVIIIDSYFDRYILPLMVGVWLLLLPEKASRQPVTTWASVALLASLYVFDLAATHDYLSWNRARQAAYQDLTTRQGIPPDQIDGGFEWNFWMNAGPINTISPEGKSWWRVQEEYYIISFGPLKGYSPIGRFPFRAWLPPEVDTLYVLRERSIVPFDQVRFPLHCGFERRTDDGLHFVSPGGQAHFSGGELQSDIRARTGAQSLKLSSRKRFGMTLHLPGARPGTQLRISIWRWGGGGQAGIVASCKDPAPLYRFENRSSLEKDDAGWEKLQLEVTLPGSLQEGQVDIYLWQPGESEVWFDDLEILTVSRPDG